MSKVYFDIHRWQRHSDGTVTIEAILSMTGWMPWNNGMEYQTYVGKPQPDGTMFWIEKPDTGPVIPYILAKLNAHHRHCSIKHGVAQ